ncbi:hypothetical protein BCR42DRAFT_490266 [Absidia repens]|uniref:C2H2-type domain-containing protein n=1 Tax=Absidia repens TaxID=90262 RepID=A0A1X2IMI2_9FUNG|nr:hypothetical protein BCR42DRAFT_490266 [Absidia repens]
MMVDKTFRQPGKRRRLKERRCNICNQNFSRPINLKDHLKTLKHQQNVSDMRLQADASMTTTNTTHSSFGYDPPSFGNNPPLHNDASPGSDSLVDGDDPRKPIRYLSIHDDDMISRRESEAWYH